MFERFWRTYPRRVSKGAALKAWDKLKPSRELVEEILTAIESQKAWRERAQKANQLLPSWKRIFIPEWKHPSTWLNQQCWLDEHDEIPGQEQKRKTTATYCANCQREEGKYPIAGKLYCIRCYDRVAHPENYAPKLRVVK